MDDHREADATERAKGSVKEAIGKLTGDAEAEAEGRAQKAAGRARTPPGSGASQGHDGEPDA